MAKLSPYLTFDNNTCAEAMSFYKDCLGGDLTLLTVKGSPMENQMPEAYHKSIMHSVLRTADFEIMASDLAQESVKGGNDVHLCVGYCNEAETRKGFNALSEGGQVVNPLSEMFFGLLGDFVDKYGKRWMMVCEKQDVPV